MLICIDKMHSCIQYTSPPQADAPIPLQVPPILPTAEDAFPFSRVHHPILSYIPTPENKNRIPQPKRCEIRFSPIGCSARSVTPPRKPAPSNASSPRRSGQDGATSCRDCTDPPG